MASPVNAFLLSHGFDRSLSVEAVAASILFDMHEGLCRRKADQDMIRTWSGVPKKSLAEKSVVVIDAGGTNFRSCVVSFDSEGNPKISEMQKTKMPGIERELSKKEFFEQIAANLDHLKNKACKIGFCFSYPMEITPEGSGILLGFSKEVKAAEVVGCDVGKCLSDALVERGWTRQEKIALLNDTQAALLAGVAAGGKKDYSSYVGFILGTGMNAAYIQPPCEEYKIEKDEIIVCEVGKFCKIPRSDFDLEFDKTTAKPRTFYMEKSSSGAYLGPVSLFALKAASCENIFSEKFSKKILELQSLSLIELDSYLHFPKDENSVLGKIASECGTKDDKNFLYEILDAVVERSARLSAAILVANVVKSGAGKEAASPVRIVCDGTTFHKTHKIAMRVEGFLEEHLFRRRSLYYETVAVENDITLGAAIAGLNS